MKKILIMNHDGNNQVVKVYNETKYNSVLKVVKYLFDTGQIMGWSADPLDTGGN